MIGKIAITVTCSFHLGRLTHTDSRSQIQCHWQCPSPEWESNPIDLSSQRSTQSCFFRILLLFFRLCQNILTQTAKTATNRHYRRHFQQPGLSLKTHVKKDSNKMYQPTEPSTCTPPKNCSTRAQIGLSLKILIFQLF
jgi:hypothetical protein